MVFAHIWSLVRFQSHIWSLPIYGLWSGFPVPTVLNPMIFGSVSLSHCVESHIWSLVWFQSHIWSLVWFQSHIWSLVRFQSHIWSLGLVSLLNPMIFRSVSLSHCVESHIWSLPIYGLWSGFNSIYGLCPYMVFGSGFPVPTVLNPMVFGSGFPVTLC